MDHSGSAPSSISGFPTPHVAVDIAVLTLLPTSRVGVLLHIRSGDRPGIWALPGRFVRENERLADCVSAALELKCGLDGQSLAGAIPRQLHVFDDPGRDDRGWVMSVAHVLALPWSELAHLQDSPGVRIVPVLGGRAKIPNRQRELPYDQNRIVRYAIADLQARYLDLPDPDNLLGHGAFTLAELRDLHAAVLGSELQIDTFRRHMLPRLTDTGEVAGGGVGRPAALFRRLEGHR